MQDFDRNNEPSLEDLANNRKFKLIILGLLAVAIVAAILDVMGKVGSWR
jgi:hypothetical protein